jgi:hypothetical protein
MRFYLKQQLAVSIPNEPEVKADVPTEVMADGSVHFIADTIIDSK